MVARAVVSKFSRLGSLHTDVCSLALLEVGKFEMEVGKFEMEVLAESALSKACLLGL